MITIELKKKKTIVKYNSHKSLNIMIVKFFNVNNWEQVKSVISNHNLTNLPVTNLFCKHNE